MLLWKPRLHRLTSAVQQRELVVVIVHRILYFTSVALSANPTLLATSMYVYAWALYHWKRIFHAKRTSHHKGLMTMYILPLPPPPEGTLIVILIRYNVNRSCQQREANNMFCVGFPASGRNRSALKNESSIIFGFQGFGLRQRSGYFHQYFSFSLSSLVLRRIPAFPSWSFLCFSLSGTGSFLTASSCG